MEEPGPGPLARLGDDALELAPEVQSRITQPGEDRLFPGLGPVEEVFTPLWQDGSILADINLDGGIDGADIEAFLTIWERGGG